MANTETKALDNIISSRRALLYSGAAIGGSALAGMLLTKPAAAATTVSTYTDADILHFALNLEYLEANFYYLAAFGTTIDVSNSASLKAGAPVVTLNGTVGTAGKVTAKANPQVPFTLLTVASYAVETAIEEARHVNFLKSALGSAAVAQPAIDLTGGATYGAGAAWNTLATAAGINGGIFDPFASDAFFLLGAYVFEDVGVTAYHGAAPLLSTTGTQPSANLQAAAGILAVEAYHAGLVRTTLNSLDATNGNTMLTGITTQISNLRSQLSLAANSGMNSNKTTTPDDFSIAAQTVTLGGASVQASQLVDADPTVVAFSRTTTQVLNIVTGGKGATSGTKAAGVFFPSGLNGLFT
jgi:hypothetical protein